MGNLRLAARSLLRAPGFTLGAVLVLAVGTGGSTAVFSVLRGVALRPLSMPRPDELVRLYERPAGSDARWPFPGPEFLDLARESSAFASVAGVRADRQTLTGRGAPVQIRVARISGSFFATLKIWPAIGRGPTPEEDIGGGSRTAVLTDGFWRRELGADPAALGRTLVLDGRTYTIGGVMPADFHFPLLRQAEVLIPLAMEGKERDFRGTNWLTLVARLRPGRSIREAQADLDVVGPRIFERIGEHKGWKMEAQPLLEDLVGPVKPALTALLFAVLLALLIACANVASLLLARGMARQRELAIRAALGGGRGDLVRLLLTEALLLAGAGGALALVLAPWALSALLSLAPKDLPRLDEVHVDGAVLTFALLTSLASGLLAGLVPALQITRPQLMDVLKQGSGGSDGRSGSRAALAVAETALAFVLAAGAGLMIRTLSGLLEAPTGLGGADRVLVADLDLPRANYPDDRIAAFAEGLMARLSSAPGFRSSALMTSMPLDPRGRADFGFALEGETYTPGQYPNSEILWATPGYLETLGIPLLRGRDLRWTDVKGAPHVVLVNQAFVQRFLGGKDPLGRRISEVLGPGNDPWEIAGVIGDVRTRGLDRAPSPTMVVPLLQYAVPSLRVAARAQSGDPLQLLAPLRAEVLALDKDLALSSPQPLSRVIAQSVGERRFQMTLLSVFALGALLLAALGIYGMTACMVTQRSREIGIRMALGADATSVRRMVLGSGLGLALGGVALGLCLTFLATRVLASLVYQVSTTDPLTLLATAAVLAVSAALASWLPARRATRVDPAISLRA
ncbi:MAG TPA: ABC transporter permease, partial [Myxococcales bacterium]|nr:ABC transporter permease [Myxococcales bacterium]